MSPRTCGRLNSSNYIVVALKRRTFERKPQIVAKMQRTIEIATFSEPLPNTVATMRKRG